MEDYPFDVEVQAAIVVMPYDRLVEMHYGLCWDGPDNEHKRVTLTYLMDEIKRRPEYHAHRAVGYEAICGLCWETFNPNTPDDLIHGYNMRSRWCGGVGVMIGGWR